MANLDPESQEQVDVANALFARGRFNDALEKYQLLAEDGSIEAQLRVGWMYQTGCGVKVDLDEARRWYLKAAESNSPEAQFYLGKLYRQKTLYEQALQCFQRSAEQNYMPSIYQLGVMNELGEGVSANKEKAYSHYKQAAGMGHLRAQRDIAVMMIKGQLGVERIPKGIFMLLSVLCTGVGLGLRRPNSDRIRW